MASSTAEPVPGSDPKNTSVNEADAITANGSTIEDHPRGDKIRRQVEFYFSDENLPTDSHLLKCCGGRENLPVSISSICGFKKMRGFKPRRLVIAALRQSAFLEVSADGKMIKRKIPLQGKCLLDPEFQDDDEIAYDPQVRKPAVFPVPLIPQKKVEYPEGVSKNMLKPTGFEKTYAEPPQTPQEAEEEEAIYDPSKPFIERIEIAIQRFKQRKRMHEMYAHVFNKLMKFGGVESGPRMYQGVSQQEIKEMDAEEQARALAIHSVPWDRSDKREWAVDFASVGAAFLSSYYPAHYALKPDVIDNACNVLRSFYNYLLSHSVCPEYEDQLKAAREMCDTAEKELPKVVKVHHGLPGNFNKSASTIFGGSQADVYTGDKTWAKEAEDEGIPIDALGLRDEEARIRFATGVAIMGSDDQYEKVLDKSIKMLDRGSIGLDVVAVELPDTETTALFNEQSEHLRRKLGQLEPLGKLKCYAWYAGDFDEWDLPKDSVKYPQGKPFQNKNGKPYEFWIEVSILSHCFVGMKLDAEVITLDTGLTMIDDITEVMCSFFTWLPNELWMKRKPREVKWLKKGLALDEDENDGDGQGKDGKKGGADDEAFDDE